LEVFQDALARLTHEPEESGTNKMASFGSELVLDTVSFSYGDTKALDGVNIVIRKNTTVGLVGRTGSGKSTLVNVLTGMLQPSSGEVRIDGVDYRSLDKESLRSRIGYVTQEGLIFRDSVVNNISFWSDEEDRATTLESVRRAARSAHADSFIQRLTNGYDTLLGDRGMTISGGQRQLISIARELFKEPAILLLDEAMSALDAEAESAVQQTLAELKGQLTVVLVTHRLSTVKECDYVYVLDHGAVVQEGTYEELLKDPTSVFAGLAELQQL
jgi:ABC-type multidrug transport system fused ATPase/permease subunit